MCLIYLLKRMPIKGLRGSKRFFAHKLEGFMTMRGINKRRIITLSPCIRLSSQPYMLLLH